MDELESHCRIVARRLRDGTVVPFLGAGANLCGRPTKADWQNDHLLPSGAELTSYLAESYAYPETERRELLRVSQYVQAMTGGNVLYRELRSLFIGDYKPTALHELLAAIPERVRAWRKRGYESRFQLIVTTNYDDALEQAFREVEEEFDLVIYLATGRHRGKFVHLPPGGESLVIKQPNMYRELSLEARTVILKIHGAVDRNDAVRDSYVITEDHYIEYLAQNAISTLIPVTLMAAMQEAHFQFLGYSLSDWNLRVILHRIWGEAPFGEQFQSWAIQQNPPTLDELLWRRRGVEILNADLADYVVALSSALER